MTRVLGTILGNLLLFVIVFWGAWILFSEKPCDRVRRAAAPVRGGVEVFGWVVHNWITPAEKLDLIATEMEWDAKAQHLLEKQFYATANCAGNASSENVKGGR